MFPRYVAAAMCYRGSRKILQLRDADMKVYDSNKKEMVRTPILFADKFMMTMVCSMMSITIWPLYVYKDIRYCELYLKPAYKRSLYSDTPSHLCDYFFL